MASSRCLHQEDLDEACGAQPTHFCKFIVPNSLRNELKIPRKFVEKYGQLLPDTMLLKLPSGAEWKVHLTKRNGEVWLQKGWKEFAEYNSLFNGQFFLVFRFERDFHFHVLIFDTSSVEIDYTICRGKGTFQFGNAKQFHVPNTENLEEQERPSCRKRKINTPQSSLQQCKMRRTNAGLEADVSPDISTGQGTCALERARAFNTQNPCFVIDVKPAYISSRFNMNLPNEFARKHFDSKKNGENIVLRMLDGRFWLAMYIIRKVRTETRYELSHKGWKAFAKDNNLKVGDACVFELLGGPEFTFQVSLFKETVYPNHSLSQESADQRQIASQGQRKRRIDMSNQCDQFISKQFPCPPRNPKFEPEASPDMSASRRTSALERARAFNPQNPFFIFDVKPSYIHSKSNMNVPNEFAKKHLNSKKNGETAVLRALCGRFWHARYIIRKSSRSTRYELSCRGWNAFAKDNNLEVGDACVFELLRRPEITFDVSIFKETVCPNHPFSQESADQRKRRGINMSNQRDQFVTKEFPSSPRKPKFELDKLKQRSQGMSTNDQKTRKSSYGDSEAVATVNSDNPFFKVTIGLSHCRPLPIAFIKEHVKHGGQIILQVGERSWSVKLILNPKPRYASFSAGWCAFKKENGLEVGDTCLFEMIRKDDIVMKVSIFKHFTVE